MVGKILKKVFYAQSETLIHVLNKTRYDFYDY